MQKVYWVGVWQGKGLQVYVKKSGNPLFVVRCRNRAIGQGITAARKQNLDKRKKSENPLIINA
jgi:hypothetical protein